MNKTDLTIITPCFNEELNVVECIEAVRKVMSSELPNLNYEHIFCDNNSTDNTFSILLDAAKLDKRIKIVRNSANIGALRNIYNGLNYASGQAVIPMLPADLQDPAEEIPNLYRLYNKGYKVVFGVRKDREESFFLKQSRKIYYKIISRLATRKIPRDSGEFLMADISVIKSILEVDDQYPYVRGLIAQTGVDSAFVQYKWKRRKAGESKASFAVLVDQAINGLISTSRVSARLALIIGLGTSFLSFALGIWNLIGKLFAGREQIHGLSTIILIITFIGGIQMLFLGLIGEYVLSIHAQVRKMPSTFPTNLVNFD